MSCTCNLKLGLQDFLPPSAIKKSVVFNHLIDKNTGHCYSFVLTKPRQLDYHYYRYKCYCQDATKKISSLLCILKFYERNEEFYDDLPEIIFVESYWTHWTLTACSYKFQAVCANYNQPEKTEATICQGENCCNPLECNQNKDLMHLLVFERYSACISDAIKE